MIPEETIHQQKLSNKSDFYDNPNKEIENENNKK